MPVFRLLEPLHAAGVALADLASDRLRLHGDGSDVRITAVTVAHTEAGPGALFAALPGRRSHGARFAADAAAAGAVAVLTDAGGLDEARASGLPVLLSDDPRTALGPVAAQVYGTRSGPVLLGVTGTNGKTSTVHLLDAVLRQLGVVSGLSSTAERRSADHVVASRLTTPEASELHALLARMAEDGVEAAAIEVSAQALVRSRVEGIVLDVAGFTNLSHDHLDDFGDLDEYLRAKQRLFTPERSRRGVVVVDTEAGRRVAREASVPVVTLSAGDGADWRIDVLETAVDRTRFRLTARDGWSTTTSVPLLGRHMASNAALALVMLVEAGHARDRVAAAVGSGIDVTVPGRTLLVSGADGPRVFLDFSHTPDSVARTVDALREVTPGRVLVLLGADGDRDPSKRAPMGRAAAERADLVIVTDHHPRFEDPARIRRALVDGARRVERCEVLEIAEPADAVRAALHRAGPSDSVLWVGPGDTDYRVVGADDLPYSPRADTARALAEAGWSVDLLD
ncbi:UDP-N-acetylmuramoyl-L-alanyl-D-glutamate--2,6-diaminopimelate ligase [Rathayibacter sp. AY1E8]|uniref:Mur ligase family protein n=1 Tax=unclassified Rathayibacter TaxID=2609250 RepID=UPI000CE7C077|nr:MULTISPECIES: UDP-N-acetylmuramoyl-L-alanyl-D-glutamate--2,6-diaminopimelate ligase [unclassified Rathayibacter]PPF10951.1 UDP-N-acetylmuramoyl-L-alanyl-D-glutamate--2,6-diaminopimelate ligase [Rathayibacter sp. AY1A5]PPG23472.1 UDP-N-acetylmuramoyl-L-alanyl-D-glutamate--2,6-diaminopimelate ligase [Rathayibacter sp. AY1E8]